eukprot:8336592-Ditylum_brightwellii.AAC.1
MVDHTTSFVYSHLIRGTTVKDTLAAKEAYDRVFHEHGHKTRSCHGDNSQFNSSEFQTLCKRAQKFYSYCRVGAHHQNGIAKAMNKCLTHSARTSLLHAKCKWPSTIASVLYPFCYKAAEERYNKLDADAEGWSSLERLMDYKDEIAA